jgi:hypothetical protein
MVSSQSPFLDCHASIYPSIHLSSYLIIFFKHRRGDDSYVAQTTLLANGSGKYASMYEKVASVVTNANSTTNLQLVLKKQLTRMDSICDTEDGSAVGTSLEPSGNLRLGKEHTSDTTPCP